MNLKRIACALAVALTVPAALFSAGPASADPSWPHDWIGGAWVGDDRRADVTVHLDGTDPIRGTVVESTANGACNGNISETQRVSDTHRMVYIDGGRCFNNTWDLEVMPDPTGENKLMLGMSFNGGDLQLKALQLPQTANREPSQGPSACIWMTRWRLSRHAAR